MGRENDGNYGVCLNMSVRRIIKRCRICGEIFRSKKDEEGHFNAYGNCHIGMINYWLSVFTISKKRSLEGK